VCDCIILYRLVCSLKTQERLWSQASPWRICDGHSAIKTGFSPSNSSFPCQYHSMLSISLSYRRQYITLVTDSGVKQNTCLSLSHNKFLFLNSFSYTTDAWNLSNFETDQLLLYVIPRNPFYNSIPSVFIMGRHSVVCKQTRKWLGSPGIEHR
jgi:hypothetical protein